MTKDDEENKVKPPTKKQGVQKRIERRRDRTCNFLRKSRDLPSPKSSALPLGQPPIEYRLHIYNNIWSHFTIVGPVYAHTCVRCLALKVHIEPLV